MIGGHDSGGSGLPSLFFGWFWHKGDVLYAAVTIHFRIFAVRNGPRTNAAVLLKILIAFPISRFMGLERTALA
jgi:hypothetical protein